MARVGERDRKRQQVVDFINVNPWSKGTAKITNAITRTGLIHEKLKLRANLLQPFPLFRKIFLCGLFVFIILGYHPPRKAYPSVCVTLLNRHA